jgi:hypothetical protein
LYLIKRGTHISFGVIPYLFVTSLPKTFTYNYPSRHCPFITSVCEGGGIAELVVLPPMEPNRNFSENTKKYPERGISIDN